MIPSQFIKSKIILNHIIFWVFVWGFFVYFFSYNSDNIVYVTWFSSLLLPIAMGASYLMVYQLIPKYLLTKQYARFTLYSVYTIIFSTYLILLAILGSFIFLTNMEMNNMPPMSRNYIFILILVFIVVTIASFINLLGHNFKMHSKNKELQKSIVETRLQFKEQELNYLKKQIHPHFLFNSLNTIYGYALKKGDDAPKMILKLSNLLDYILYQIEKPQVLLKDEINHLLDYVSLEKMRFHDTLEVIVNKKVCNENAHIAPMLLIPFVENSFKHGNIIEGKMRVEINIETKDDKLLFEITNSSVKEGQLTNGIGLENIKKRLEMLYPKHHKIDIKQTENHFKVNLEIIDLKKLKNAENN